MRQAVAQDMLLRSMAGDWQSRKSEAAQRVPLGRLRFHHVTTILSAIPSEIYPPDPAVVRALREVDPRVVPITIRKVYRTQGNSLVTRTYNGIAISDTTPQAPITDGCLACLMPSYPSRPRLLRPTRVLYHLWDPGKRDPLVPGPGAWLPFDWRWYHALQSVQDDITAAEAKELRETKGRDAEAAAGRKAALDRASYNEVADDKYIEKHVSAFDLTDWKNVERGVLKAPSESAPFVDLGA